MPKNSVTRRQREILRILATLGGAVLDRENSENYWLEVGSKKDGTYQISDLRASTVWDLRTLGLIASRVSSQDRDYGSYYITTEGYAKAGTGRGGKRG